MRNERDEMKLVDEVSERRREYKREKYVLRYKVTSLNFMNSPALHAVK